MLRRAGIKTAVLFTESPYDDDAQARMAELVDQCWTTERSSVRRFLSVNPNSGYVQHAFDPERHRPLAEIPADTPAHDVVFVGTGLRRADRVARGGQLEGHRPGPVRRRGRCCPRGTA